MAKKGTVVGEAVITETANGKQFVAVFVINKTVAKRGRPKQVVLALTPAEFQKGLERGEAIELPSVKESAADETQSSETAPSSEG